MRQIGTLPTEAEAQSFADYLFTQDIRVNVDADGEAWAVWVYDEDKVPAAKTELDAFRENPSAEKYSTAASQASALREKEIKQHRAARKRVVRASDNWNRSIIERCPVMITLIALSVAAVMVTTYPNDLWNFGRRIDPWRTRLSLAPIRESSREGYVEIPRNTFEAVFEGEVWRLFTPMFLHIDPPHLFFNMWWLRGLGELIETRRGKWKFLFLVLLIAGVSNAAQGWFNGPAVANFFLIRIHAMLALLHMDWLWMETIIAKIFYGIAVGFRPGPSFGGMSGVVFGLFGYIWMQARFVRNSGFDIAPNLVMFMLIYMVVCYFGVLGPIANTAHTVGLIVGMIAGYAPKLWRDMTR